MFNDKDMMGNLLGGKDNFEDDDSKRKGVNIATVVSLKDPKKLGRVRCKFITADEDIGETEWAYITSPFAGKNYGMFVHPRVGDVVLLAFEDGNIHVPYVVGSIWWRDNETDNTPPVEINDENIESDIYKISTPKGHIITLVDKKDEEKIEIASMDGHTLRFDDKNKKIELVDKNGNGMTLETEQGVFSIKCKEFKVDAGGHTFTLGAQGAAIETKASVSIKGGSEATIEASGDAKVKGTGLNLEASGIANLKGAQIKIG